MQVYPPIRGYTPSKGVYPIRTIHGNSIRLLFQVGCLTIHCRVHFGCFSFHARSLARVRALQNQWAYMGRLPVCWNLFTSMGRLVIPGTVAVSVGVGVVVVVVCFCSCCRNCCGCWLSCKTERNKCCCCCCCSMSKTAQIENTCVFEKSIEKYIKVV